MRLIDGDALWDKFDSTMTTLVKSTTQENLTNEALSLLCGSVLISNAPTVDAVPVVHGRWVDEDFPDKPATYVTPAICSECGEMAHKIEHGYNILSKYCPNCGAKMDLEGENGRPDTAESGG